MAGETTLHSQAQYLTACALTYTLLCVEGDSSVDRRRLEFNLSNSSDTCLSTTPTPVKLVTGWAIVEPKTDCWLTELEFERLMR